MSLISVVLVLVLIGILLWVLFRFVPMDPDMKVIIKVLVIVVVILWLLQVFGVLGTLGTIHVGK
jgi:Kef-type K+ transport system membrane component KefB